MSHRCSISGVSRQHGHRVSHAKNKTNHVFKANIQTKRIFVPSLGKTVKIKVSANILRTIDKLGFEGALKKHGVTVAQVIA
jgi:large subunit ribosomal protein L28